MPSVRELTRAAHQLAFSQTKMETSSERRNNHYDVIIVGLGPVGAVAANLMGSYGVRTLVLEKEQEIYKGPRAVAIDSETTRIFGMIDLDDWLDKHVGKAEYQILSGPEGRGWTIMDVPRPALEFGYSKIGFFYQPTVESTLRDNLEKYPSVLVWLGYHVVGVAEGSNGIVHVKTKFIGGMNEEVYTCKYLLACDGGRSSVRKLLKLKYKGSANPESWLVLDVSSKNEELHRKLSKCTYVIAGRNPYIHIPLPESCHRFEFLLNDNDDPQSLTQVDRVEELLGSIGVDVSDLVFHRRIIYKFHLRSAERMNVGHTFLLGDAAHCLPPFRGQGSTGMCCGIRDAANLCWKIALFVNGTLQPGSVVRKPLLSSTSGNEVTPGQVYFDRLASSYHKERSPHVELMMRHALLYGSLTKLRNPIATFVRDVFFTAAVQLPFVRRLVWEDSVKPAPTVVSGFIDDQSSATAGLLFPQSYVMVGGKRKLLDKALGCGFVVMGWEQNPKLLLNMDCQSKLTSLGCTFVTVFREQSSEQQSDYFSGCIAIEDTEGAIGSWFEKYKASFVLLRPDRFVFGHADNSLDASSELIGRFHNMLTKQKALTVRKPPLVLLKYVSKCKVATGIIVVIIIMCIILLLYAFLL
ncbi:3-(3-hydroxy-phenyl)propionate/3-hydroxycinnamic acid hydroxylase-like [Corticium candelabrum]|uniref:3-(3-hydroxy-phenyl)propionate/3-hydroxycinnamic acid hydroxylase-like n=1 Tax=Corticium candelabrum TaxID=121492 RepID=UPI002E26B0D6|nr:3-(3-hydroxy-phenyl)propionate/3-hydroxycinnamic acid hydroxylase-like [Corticium candelabrum]